LPAEAPRGATRSRLGQATSGGVLAGRILAEARESFAEHGYAGTTIRAVAQAADVDPALVYHYDSKEKLLDAATTLPRSF
jgi:AcrR family transcriptional regulator